MPEHTLSTSPPVQVGALIPGGGASTVHRARAEPPGLYIETEIDARRWTTAWYQAPPPRCGY